MFTTVLSVIVKKIENDQMSFNKLVGKQTVVHQYNRQTWNKKKKMNYDTIRMYLKDTC